MGVKITERMSRRNKKPVIDEYIEEDGAADDGDFEIDEPSGGNQRRRRGVLSVDEDIEPTLLAKEQAGTLSKAEEKELKKQRKLLKNRLAAQLFRKRQKDHVEELQNKLQTEEQKQGELKKKIKVVKEQNEKTKAEIETTVEKLLKPKNV